MKRVQLTTLIENTVYQKKLIAEHGFSLLIESDDESILFDTGQTSFFIHNAIQLNADIAKVDYCVISHGHYDHTGGLASFCGANDRADILIHPYAFAPRYNDKAEFIGIPYPEKMNHDRFRFVDAITPITESVYIIPAALPHYEDDIHIKGFFIEFDGERMADDFSDEQSLCIVKDNKLTIISGCSHRGVCNIIKSAVDYFHLPVSLVLGGFHLRKEMDETVEKVISILNSFSVEMIGVSHCTGVEKFAEIQNGFNGKIFYNSTGNKLLI